MNAYRVEIDHSICSGTSNCAEEAPDAYEINDRGLAVLKPGDHPLEALCRGAESCPVEAIRVYDATGRRIYP